MKHDLPLLAALLCAGLPTVLSAADPPAPALAAPQGRTAQEGATRAAWERLRAVERGAQDAMAAAQDAFMAAGRTPEARKAYGDAMIEARRDTETVTREFAQSFAASDWSSWEAPADALLLERGLFLAGQTGLDEDPALATRAFETFLARFPQAPPAATVRQVLLPMAYVAAGPAELAVERIAALARAHSTPVDQAFLQLALGDALAVLGRGDAARAAYEEALRNAPEDLQRTDSRGRVRRDAQLRLKLVGLPAPEIDFPNWLGAPARPLSALRGQVVLVDFWATWCEPCRAVMPKLNALYGELRDQGVVVLGVTRYYEMGFMPDGGADLNRGQPIEKIGAAEFSAHLQKFRDASGIRYPFVVADVATFRDAYGVTGIPTLVVVGKDGKVRYVSVGTGTEAALRAAVREAIR